MVMSWEAAGKKLALDYCSMIVRGSQNLHTASEHGDLGIEIGEQLRSIRSAVTAIRRKIHARHKKREDDK